MATKPRKKQAVRPKKINNKQANFSIGTFITAKRSIIFVILFALVGGALLVFVNATASFQYLATHPQASTETTANSKIIKTLRAWNGKLYAGYGDWGANTGPISVTPFNPITKSFEPTLHTSDTDAIEVWRVIGGKLYAPAIDRKTNADFAVATPTTSGVYWADKRPLYSTHVFDAVTLTGNDLWLAGSKGKDAVLWRSLDGGVTWNTVLTLPPQTDPTTNFARFYFVTVLDGKLYAQASDYTGGNHLKSKVFDGISWSDGPNIIGTSIWPHKPEIFTGKVVFKNWPTTSASNLLSFNGTSSTAVLSSVYDFTINGTYLYTLRGDGSVARTSDLVSWQTVAIAPNTARSIEVLNGVIYVGTTDSKIYAADLSQAPSDTISPSTALKTPSNGAVLSDTRQLQADAADNVGVAKVEFYAGNNLVGTDNNAPYEFSWNTKGYTNGQYDLKAIAYDAAGNAGSSEIVSATVSNIAISDTEKPIVNISEPKEGSTLAKSNAVQAAAQDNGNIVRMEIMFNGSVIATSSGSSISTRLNTNKMPKGSYILVVVAYDSAGNIGSSQITVNI